ncbi:hypothetical protein SLEP1_g27900 [Rubroshorea leprosula]|uniref:Bidirectional sugar transporter SWEET n=1 Tax=Rubroshorea leprosula TaxID=152421 RepID=A0AAV5K3B6_9ROSI|nr:hypothetical protein SLEP1_g27900 [Rubroshorea leprosula]
MAFISTHIPWLVIFGVLGNLSSFVVFLSPIPTFYRIWRKKSTEDFHSIPYLTALFSAMLWIYYALLKSSSDAILLITINGLGCIFKSTYIAIYITYAPKQARISTLKLLFLFNFLGFCSMFLPSYFLVKGLQRVQIVGWICMIFSLMVFAAPLSVVRLVIRTKSAEFMPFFLSFFLTLSAFMWLFYGLLLRDWYITIPNVPGLILGLLQMVLYVVYRPRTEHPNTDNKTSCDQSNENKV